MSDINTRVVISGRDLASAAISSAAKSARSLEEAAQQASGGVMSLGASLASVAAAGGLGVSLGGAVSRFADLEEAITDIQRVSTKPFEQIHAELNALNPALGSTKDLAKGFYEVLSAGVTDPVKALETLEAAAKASKAAHVDQGQTVTALTKLMAGYGNELKSAAEASDLLFQIEAQGQAKFSELVPIIGETAAMAHNLGISSKEMGGALSQATLTAGSTAQAATQLNAIYTQLLKPSEEMQRLFDSIAKRHKEVTAATGEGIVKAFGFAGALEKISEAAGGSKEALARAFSDKEGISGFLSLAVSGGQALRDQIKGMDQAAGQTEASFSRWSQTFKGVSETFTNTLGKPLEDFGARVAPMLVSGMTEFAGVVTSHQAEISALFDKIVADGREIGVTAVPAIQMASGALGGLVSLYQSLPAEITGAAGAGIMGRIIFGSWAPAKIIATIDLLNSSYSKINAQMGYDDAKDVAPLPSLSQMQRSYSGAVTAIQNMWNGPSLRPPGVKEVQIEDPLATAAGDAAAAEAKKLAEVQAKAREDEAKAVERGQQQRLIADERYGDLVLDRTKGLSANKIKIIEDERDKYIAEAERKARAGEISEEAAQKAIVAYRADAAQKIAKAGKEDADQAKSAATERISSYASLENAVQRAHDGLVEATVAAKELDAALTGDQLGADLAHNAQQLERAVAGLRKELRELDKQQEELGAKGLLTQDRQADLDQAREDILSRQQLAEEAAAKRDQLAARNDYLDRIAWMSQDAQAMASLTGQGEFDAKRLAAWESMERGVTTRPDRADDYVRQYDAEMLRILQDQTRELAAQRGEYAALTGDVAGVFQAQLDQLEVEKLLAGTAEERAVIEAKIAQAKARANLDVGALADLGAARAALDAHARLADQFENILPASVDVFADSFGSLVDAIGQGEDAGAAFLATFAKGLADVAQNIAMTIIKMEALKALGYGQESGGGGLLSGVGGGLLNAVVGGIGSLFGGGGITIGDLGANPNASITGASYFNAAHAQGDAMTGPGIKSFENQIVTTPTFFWANGGNIMGEAGPEGIMPLGRTSSGKLGVHAVSGGSDEETRSLLREIRDGLGRREQPPTRIVNVLDPGVMSNFLSSSAGERVVLNIIQRNRSALGLGRS